MMKLTSKLCCALGILVILFSAPAGATARNKIVIASDYWCPYACAETDKDPGYLVETVKSIFDIYDIDVEYRMMPWFTALDELTKDKIDAVVGISALEGRNFLLTDTPISYGYVSAFTRDDSNWIYDGVGSLNGKKVSIILDYNVSDDIKEFVASHYPNSPNLFIIESDAYAVYNALTGVLNGSAGVFIEDETVVNYYIKHHNISHIKNAGRIVPDAFPMYIAFSKTSAKSENYKKMLEEGIHSLNATGDIKALKQKYNLTN